MMHVAAVRYVPAVARVLCYPARTVVAIAHVCRLAEVIPRRHIYVLGHVLLAVGASTNIGIPRGTVAKFRTPLDRRADNRVLITVDVRLLPTDIPARVAFERGHFTFFNLSRGDILMKTSKYANLIIDE